MGIEIPSNIEQAVSIVMDAIMSVDQKEELRQVREENLSDGRPYYIECWAEDQLTMLTFFFSTSGIDKYTETMLKELLVEEKYVQFIKKDAPVSVMHFIDASENELWSVNVCIGTEDEIFANDLISLRAYEKLDYT